MVGRNVVFNINGNQYRLTAFVNFNSKHVLVRWIDTHAEYEKLDVGNL